MASADLGNARSFTAIPMVSDTSGVMHKMIHSGQTDQRPNAQADWYMGASLALQHGFYQMLGIPVVTRGGTWGAMVLACPFGVLPEASQVDLLETFASRVVITIENVRQFRELQTRLEREAATQEDVDAIAQSRNDETPVVDAIICNAQRLCETQASVLIPGRADGPPQRLVAHTGISDSLGEHDDTGAYPIDPDFSIGARAIVEKRIIQTDDTSETKG